MHPILLVGAALAGLPILLHLLLKQEPKRLTFPALRFLKLTQKTSERKIRLRHFILLALRCLLIALFALTLYQPKANSSGLNLTSEEPVAAVFILDSSPSMGYRSNRTTRFEEARRRALDLLSELPANSRVAVIDPNEATTGWEQSTLDARRRIEAMTEPAGSAPPITTTLATAYQLLRNVDEEIGEGGEPLPRLVAVFGDRASSSWESGRLEELKKLGDSIPLPKPVQMFVDVGEDQPSNVSIVSVDMKPQRISASADVVVNVVLRAVGTADTNVQVTAQLGMMTQTADVPVTSGSPSSVALRFANAKWQPGFQTVTVSISEDNLTSDNSRTLTFEVAARRKILTISDDLKTADAWELSHNSGSQEFDCTVVTTSQVPELDGYEAVVLLDVRNPEPLAKKLIEYVEKSAGKLVVIPDGPDTDNQRGEAYNQALGVVLPARFGPKSERWTAPPGDTKRANGFPWKLDDDRDLVHPLLAPLREFKRQGNIDIFDPKRWRKTVRYRTIQDLAANAIVIASFDNSDTAMERAPALLERAAKAGNGRVLVLTSRFDFDASTDGPTFWNDDTRSDGHSWPTILPWLMLRYLCGSSEDAQFNFTTGQEVVVPVPRFAANTKRTILVEGPGILPRDAAIELSNQQSELRLTPPKTLSAGVYTVRSSEKTNPWESRFSLNVPASESLLEKVPPAAITDLFGPNGLATVGREVKFAELLTNRLDRPLELFPYLMVLVLIFFVFEGYLANRFYRVRK
jgi:hypothetical protein